MDGDMEGIYANRTRWYWLCLMCPKLSPTQTKGNVTIVPRADLPVTASYLVQIQSDPHFTGFVFVWDLGGAKWAGGPGKQLCA